MTVFFQIERNSIKEIKSNQKLWKYMSSRCLESSGMSAHNHNWLIGQLHVHLDPTSMFPNMFMRNKFWLTHSESCLSERDKQNIVTPLMHLLTLLGLFFSTTPSLSASTSREISETNMFYLQSFAPLMLYHNNSFCSNKFCYFVST